MDRRDHERRWRPRPLFSFALRSVSVLVPAAAGATSAYAFVGALPMPRGLALIPWAFALVVISTVATATAERVGKRFLPLAVLFRLSLVFPDRAPSRFAMARGAGNVRQLERRIGEARERGVDPEPVRAAEQILSLVAALSAHDRKTRGHSERVRAFTDLVVAELRLSEQDRDRLRWAALLHDIGKINVPARILNKPGRPDAREWERLQAHPVTGARMAEPLMAWLGPWGHAIEQHHERFGGGGYPHALEGEQISLAARIVSVADSFEVMTAARSYKKPMSVPAARRELAACAGTQFDPAIVRAFLNVSLGKLWWTVGPMSWTALVPILGPAQRASGQLAAAAAGATAAVVVGVLPILWGAAGPSVGPATAAATAAGEDRADGAVLEDGPDRTDGEGAADAAGGEEEHVGVPGAGQGSDDGADDGTDGSGGGGTSGGDVTDGIDRVIGDALEGTTQTVDGVVDGAAETVQDVVDGTTDAAGDLLGGTAVSEAVEDPIESVTGALGGLLGS